MKKVKQFQIIELTRNKHPDGTWLEVNHKSHSFCESREEAERILNWLVGLHNNKDNHLIALEGDHVAILNKKRNHLSIYTIAPIEHINITEVNL